MPPKNQPARTAPPPPPAHIPEIVDPKWLLRAGAISVAVALLFAYAATCMLFYKAQWQLVLKPSHTDSHQPSDFGLTATPVTFGADATGTPQLHGWTIPTANPTAPWVLMLPAGEGSAGDSLSRAHTFHDLGYQVLVFDYRGFGASLGQHPTQAFMQQDSENALAFLKGQPGFSAGQLVLYGAGAGASLATRLADANPEVAALVLEQPDGDFTDRARLDPRAKPVPFGLLFHEDFPLADRLHTLKTPKLLIFSSTTSSPPIAKQASDPKMVLQVRSANDPGVSNGLARFLDMYLPHAPATLLPGTP